MKKRGPPTKFNQKLGEAFIRLSKEGKTTEEIAQICGVSKRTLQNWMGKDTDLMLSVREARQIADELVEAALFSRATGYSHPEIKHFAHEGIVTDERETEKHYPPDTTAIMFWLRNRNPKKWREKTEGDVNVNNNVSLGTLTDEQLDARIKALSADDVVKGE